MAESVQDWESTYARNWRFLATDDAFLSEGRRMQGLKLPHAVLRKIFQEDARHWIPTVQGWWLIRKRPTRRSVAAQHGANVMFDHGSRIC